MLTAKDVFLDADGKESKDVSCTPMPPNPPEPECLRIEDLVVVCDAITITTTDISGDDVLFVTAEFVGNIVRVINVPVGADGVAVIPPPGDLDPSLLKVVYDGKTRFEREEAIDAPCEAVPPDPRSSRKKEKTREYE